MCKESNLIVHNISSDYICHTYEKVMIFYKTFIKQWYSNSETVKTKMGDDPSEIVKTVSLNTSLKLIKTFSMISYHNFAFHSENNIN